MHSLKISVKIGAQISTLSLTLLVLDFLVHSGIDGGYILPTDFETSVTPQVFAKSNKMKAGRLNSVQSFITNKIKKCSVFI